MHQLDELAEYGSEMEYYQHNNEQLQPMLYNEVATLDLFEDADSLYSMGLGRHYQ